jgi:general stress protein 26
MERTRTQESSDVQVLARLQTMVKKARVAMLTTLDPKQELRSRPLHTERMDEDGTLWFIVGADAPKVGEIHQHDGKVCVSYADTEHQNYVSLTGTARLVDDPARKAELWSAIAEAWFPGGKTDPAVGLLRVTPERGEYWDGPSSAAGQIFALARAALTGDVSGFGTQRKFTVN